MHRLAIALLLLSSALVAPALAEDPVLTLAPDDARYQAIIAVLQPAVAADVGQDLRLEVKALKTQGDFAYVAAETLNPDGSAIDFSKTSYADALADGLFDGPHLWAYLKQDDGQWVVLEQDIGPPDAYFMFWPASHGGSCTLTGLGPDC